MRMAIIEFELNPGVEEEFQRLTQQLLPHLSEIEGFLGEDPAASLNHEGRMYEISYWRDDKALAEWSQHWEHVAAKDHGRAKLLRWYRIRVGSVDRDWTVGAAPAS
jgi:heme-degrading monooxygenase HmoA